MHANRHTGWDKFRGTDWPKEKRSLDSYSYMSWSRRAMVWCNEKVDDFVQFFFLFLFWAIWVNFIMPRICLHLSLYQSRQIWELGIAGVGPFAKSKISLTGCLAPIWICHEGDIRVSKQPHEDPALINGRRRFFVIQNLFHGPGSFSLCLPTSL